MRPFSRRRKLQVKFVALTSLVAEKPPEAPNALCMDHNSEDAKRKDIGNQVKFVAVRFHVYSRLVLTHVVTE